MPIKKLTITVYPDYYSAMHRKKFRFALKLISICLAANLLLFIGLIAAHHHHHDHDHEHNETSPGHCSLCFVAHSLSSVDQLYPVALAFGQKRLLFTLFNLNASLNIKKSIWLQHPAINGPPAA
jgi:hypothetical protein